MSEYIHAYTEDLEPQHRASIALETYLASDKWLSPPTEPPQPHQRAAMKDISRGLNEGHISGNVVMPTAGGKTFLIAKLAEAFSDAGLRVLIPSPTKTIINQILGQPANDADEPRGITRFTPELLTKVKRHYGGQRAGPGAQVVLTTYAGFNNLVESGELGEFDVWLADEAHRGLGRLTSKNLTESSPDAVKIGFTATPDYAADKKVSQIFRYNYHDRRLRDGIEMGILAPLQCLLYKTDTEIPYLDSRQDFSEAELAKLIYLKSRNEKAVEFAKNFIAAGRQGVIACVPGEMQGHARLLARELDGQMVKRPDGSSKKIVARAVGSFMRGEVQDRVLAAYERGEVDVLTFVNVLSEGWDSKRASFLINACPTTSIVKITQLMGRVLRPKANGMDSITVDFLDESKKSQATMLAALGEERFELGKLFAPPKYTRERDYYGTYMRHILSPDLWAQIESLNMKLLSQLNLRVGGESDPNARLFAQYEALLAKEGMPAEIVDKMGAAKYGRIKDINRKLLKAIVKDDQSAIEELVKTDQGLPWRGGVEWAREADMVWRRQIERLRERQPMDYTVHSMDPAEVVTILDAEVDEAEDTEEIFETNHRENSIRQTLDALPERERRIIELRFGFEGNPWTLENIGHELDMTRERVRQLEGQALARLSGLREFMRLIEGSVSRKNWAIESIRGEIKEAERIIRTETQKLKEYSDESLLRNDSLMTIEWAEIKKLIAEHRLAHVSSQEGEAIDSGAGRNIEMRSYLCRLVAEAWDSRDGSYTEKRIPAVLEMVRHDVSMAIHIPLEDEGAFKAWLHDLVARNTARVKAELGLADAAA